jgi:hypothetical protein
VFFIPFLFHLLERPYSGLSWRQKTIYRRAIQCSCPPRAPNPPKSGKCEQCTLQHHCRLCRAVQPNHSVWECPSCRDCFYCKSQQHTHDNCPHPHVLCFQKTECIVPIIHHHNLSRKSRQCPACHMHTPYYNEYYDGEDGTYDDIDWESTRDWRWEALRLKGGWCYILIGLVGPYFLLITNPLLFSPPWLILFFIIPSCSWLFYAIP